MDKRFSVAVIGGTGQLGRGLAFRLAIAGAGVIVGSRDPQKAQAVVESFGAALEHASISGASNLEAAEKADIAIIAVPYSSHAGILSHLKAALRTKTVIDAVVPLERGKPLMPQAGSALLEAQSILEPGARLAGAFHHIAAVELLDPRKPMGDVLICGDSDEAKKETVEIVQRLGGRGLDAGPSAYAYILEGLTAVLIYLNRKYRSKHSGLRITGIGE